jgi:hypothetical protein
MNQFGLGEANMGTSPDEFFTEHLPYEIGMVRDSMNALITPQLPEFEKNAFIETFCLHARNLIEFFKNKDACDFDPRSFVDAFFRLNKRFIGDAALPRINEQISHLTKGRTANPKEKINGVDLGEMHQAIEAEIERFAQHLKPEWQGKWKVGPLQLSPQTMAMLAMTTTSSTKVYVTRITP